VVDKVAKRPRVILNGSKVKLLTGRYESQSRVTKVLEGPVSAQKVSSSQWKILEGEDSKSCQSICQSLKLSGVYSKSGVFMFGHRE
jgi:hypothetical protein